MKPLLILLAMLSLAACDAVAAVNLLVSGGGLRNQAGTPLANGGLVALVVKTNGSIFAAPPPGTAIRAGAAWSPDDWVLAVWEIDSIRSGVAGGFVGSVMVDYAAMGITGLGAGDKLMIVWFPGATLGAAVAAPGSAFGSYRIDAIINRSDIGWVMPDDSTGGAVSLNLLPLSLNGETQDSALNASQLVGSTPTAPVISVQPVAQTATLGSTANFSVTAYGAATLSYQWRKNGKVVSGATADTYAVLAAQQVDVANYDVIVSNSVGLVTSSAAGLSVTFPGGGGTMPAFAINPTDRSGLAAGTVTFTSSATGSATVAYQWFHDGSPISGATTASLPLSDLKTTDAGSYVVTATNAAGSVPSTAATLTVRASFAAFQSQYFTTVELTNTSVSGPTADPDYDGPNNLQEYAFGFNPRHNDPGSGPTLSINSGRLALRYIRRRDVGDIVYTVEVSSNLINWDSGISFTEEIGATSLDANRDWVTVRDLTALSGVVRRFLRLKMALASPSTTTTTPPLGAVNVAFSPGTRFAGMPLVNPSVVRDVVTSHSSTVLTLGSTTSNVGALLDAAGTYFVEITAAPTPTYIGERLEIDVAATKVAANNTIALTLASSRGTLPALPVASGLAGSRVVVRQHLTLGQLFGTKDNPVMQGSTVVSGADQVQFLNPITQSFETHYFLRNGTGSVMQWTKVGGGSSSQDQLPIASGVGFVVVRNAATPVTLGWIGEVRQNAFAQPFVVGNNLIASPYPQDQSPLQRSMTFANGFTGATVVGSADQIQIHAGVAVQTYYLLRNGTGSVEQWTLVGGGNTSYSPIAILAAEDAVIVHRVTADALYFEPLPPNLAP